MRTYGGGGGVGGACLRWVAVVRQTPKQMSDVCYCQTPDESVQRVKRENAMLRDKGCQNPGETHILKETVPIWTSFSESSKTSFPLAGAMNYDFSC